MKGAFHYPKRLAIKVLLFPTDIVMHISIFQYGVEGPLMHEMGMHSLDISDQARFCDRVHSLSIKNKADMH